MARAAHGRWPARSGPGLPRIGRRPPRGRRTERGVALLAVVVFVSIVLGVYAVGRLGDAAERERRASRTAEALASARQALIAYAATDDIRASGAADQIRPGSLPCPDADGDGRVTVGADIVGGACRVYVGRIPWNRLGIPPPVDDAGEVLWYALSPQFRDVGSLEPDALGHLAQGGLVHPDAPGVLSITEQPGGLTHSGVVAIVFAPGPALGSQSRGGAGAFEPANYLDGDNGSTATAFVAATASATFNDRLLAVTRDDLMAMGERRALAEVSRALAAYFARHGYLPPPAAFGDAECTAWTVSAGQCPPVDGLAAGRVPASITLPRAAWPSPTGEDPDRVLGPSGSGLWFGGQRWRENLIYLVAPACTIPGGSCASGDLALVPGTGPPRSAAFVLVAGGSAGPGQSRADAAARGVLDNYLEGETLAAAARMAAGGAPEPLAIAAGTRAVAWLP
jgi:hypothetical protein